MASEELIFADTSYWIALLNPSDINHFRAVRLTGGTNELRLVTSEFVLIELLNHFSSRHESLRVSAYRLAHALRLGPRAGLISVTCAGFGAALELNGARKDKGWSLVDCSSFVLMRQLGIYTAMTTDRHYEQAGFIALLREH